MMEYGFVNNQVITQMDTIANTVQSEINRVINNREIYFPQLRNNENRTAQLRNDNDQLRKDIALLSEELFRL